MNIKSLNTKDHAMHLLICSLYDFNFPMDLEQEHSYFIIFCFFAYCGSAGLLCHLDDDCVSDPCQEGALCDPNPINGDAICTCRPGFTGSSCSEDIDECTIGKAKRIFHPVQARLFEQHTHTVQQ